MENFENISWENPPSPAEYEKELKKIRKNLRKRNVLLILTSLVLAAALLFGTVQYGIPFLESFYWDPRTVSFGTENGTDLDMVLAAYANLFCPTVDIRGTNVAHNGFASYSLTLERWDEIHGVVSDSYGTLEKGELFIPSGVWECAYGNHVGSYFMNDSDWNAVNRRYFTEKLAQLPEYIQIGAFITFKEDKTIHHTLDFFDELCNENRNRINQTGRYWMAVRHGDEMGSEARCGISFSDSSIDYPEMNAFYPAFSPYHAYEELNYSYVANSQYGPVYETHFKSMLQYLDDQLKQGTGIPAPTLPSGESNPNFYADTLSYVEENGVMVYGCYIVTTPLTLLELMDREDVLFVYPTEGWLNI